MYCKGRTRKHRLEDWETHNLSTWHRLAKALLSIQKNLKGTKFRFLCPSIKQCRHFLIYPEARNCQSNTQLFCLAAKRLFPFGYSTLVIQYSLIYFSVASKQLCSALISCIAHWLRPRLNGRRRQWIRLQCWRSHPQQASRFSPLLDWSFLREALYCD